ncbi:MAG: [FeFe] hydrogenase H-cluster radical SAM maturase HydG [Peptococcaceae bacterium]|nr:MAG: [FeFe] hydrogenase H-cluster radical SAM maturase HydG [Peptococcaceae bacterium]
MTCFINEDLIVKMLGEARFASRKLAAKIIEKAGRAGGIEPAEAAVLLQAEDPEIIAGICRAARMVKEEIYGRRVVFFAPLYISNYCVNNCRYCGYRRDNKFERRLLSKKEIIEEVKILLSAGHKRVALECGEDPARCSIDYVLEAIETIYLVREGNGSIRRINVNIAATTVENYKKLKDAGIGTYVLFQETYHRPTYARMHPAGPKSDYEWHLTAMNRAVAGGIDDVGVGVLFGLHDFKFEVLSLLLHVRYLEESAGVGPHTISVPRLRPAPGVDLLQFPYLVSDSDFKKLVAVLRLAVPYTGLILSTRERPSLRSELISLGVSQLSAGSSTGVGGYGNRAKAGSSAGNGEADTQFSVEDRRTLDEVVGDVCRTGYLPSFCTACYRQGRTGERFMAMAKSGLIQDLCTPNALLTLQEYLLDYASPETIVAGERVIKDQVSLIGCPSMRFLTGIKLQEIKRGERDLFF